MEKKKESKYLNNKEYEELNKAHEEFNKTMYGKTVKIHVSILTFFGIVAILLGGAYAIVDLLCEGNYYIISAMCICVFFIIVALVIVCQTIYEHMVMDYTEFKKKKN